MITQNNKAFLLIEVLITIVIVSASIIFINHAFTTSLKATALSNDYLKALLFLSDKGFDLDVGLYDSGDRLTGTEEFMGTTFYWETQISDLEGQEILDEYDEEEVGLNMFKLFLRWKRQGTEREIEITTYTESEESRGF